MQQIAYEYTSDSVVRSVRPSSTSGACQRNVPSMRNMRHEEHYKQVANSRGGDVPVILYTSDFNSLCPKSDITHLILSSTRTLAPCNTNR